MTGKLHENVDLVIPVCVCVVLDISNISVSMVLDISNIPVLQISNIPVLDISDTQD